MRVSPNRDSIQQISVNYDSTTEQDISVHFEANFHSLINRE